MVLAIALLVLAVVLLAAELAVPSFGILGFGSATAYAFALVKAFAESQEVGYTFLGLGIILLPIAIAVGLKVLPKTAVGRRMILQGGGSTAVADKSAVARRWLGRRGVAATDLRPVGTGDFDGERVDVTAASGFVPRGTPIVVAAAASGRIEVEAETTIPS